MHHNKPASQMTHQPSTQDIDAAWQFMVAAAPQLVSQPLADGDLTGVAMQALQARLALTMRLQAEYVPVRRDWRDAVTALERSFQQMTAASEAVQAAGVPAQALGTPAQTARQATAHLCSGSGDVAASPAPVQQPAEPTLD